MSADGSSVFDFVIVGGGTAGMSIRFFRAANDLTI
jgi:hypothetical protein